MHEVSFLFSCYLFSPGLRMDVHENGKATRRSQHTLTAAAAGPHPPRRRCPERSPPDVVFPHGHLDINTTDFELRRCWIFSVFLYLLWFPFKVPCFVYMPITRCAKQCVFCRRWRGNRSDAVLKLGQAIYF